jgi:cytochrome c biogenesis protein CcdA
MLLYVVAFAGGLLTIVSPCILPVLPLVFAQADRPFRRAAVVSDSRRTSREAFRAGRCRRTAARRP